MLIGNAPVRHTIHGANVAAFVLAKVTCNPRDPTRVPGGSSGGSAAAVAAAQCVAALGSDTGITPASVLTLVSHLANYFRVDTDSAATQLSM